MHDFLKSLRASFNTFELFNQITELEGSLDCPMIDNIKIMPCVKGDRSDCQPEASSIARSRRLRAVVVVEG